MTIELNLVQTWIYRYLIIDEKGDECPEAEACYWAFKKLDDLCWREPEIAWKIILEILRHTKNRFVLDNLSAGPLESLLTRHGNEIMTVVELEANSNANFRELLSGVWRNQIAEDLWKRIQLMVNSNKV